MALLNAEKVTAIDGLYGGKYAQAGFDISWQKVLFNQFHDILPGSGIGINYVDAARKYAEVARFASDETRSALEDIASRVQSDGVSVLVFNPLSWPRTEVVEFESQFPKSAAAVTATDSSGRPLALSQLTQSPQGGPVRLRLLAEDVPALGYELITLHSQTAKAPDQPTHLLQAAATSLENDFLKLTIDPATGCITSLYDKRAKTETLAPAVPGEGAPATLPDGKPCGNLLQAFVDKPKRWDAWNVDADFIKQHTDLMKAAEVQLIENTPLRATLRVRHKWQNSEFVQDITMYPAVPRIDVRMQADWHEKHILLKVAFPLSVRSDKATFEIPYGTVERPTTRNTPTEQAQFEVPALRWADLSDASHGFSLLNDSKYGYDAKDNVLRLSLLRAPDYPDPDADQGHHEFTYSLYPHAGTWREALTVRQGYELNDPLLATTTGQHAGALPPEQSFFVPQESNVVVTAVKKAADGSGIIVRFYEWAGKTGAVHLVLPQPAASAMETNLIEQPGAALALGSDGTTLTIPTGAYEIKTVKLQFRNAAVTRNPVE